MIAWSATQMSWAVRFSVPDKLPLASVIAMPPVSVITSIALPALSVRLSVASALWKSTRPWTMIDPSLFRATWLTAGNSFCEPSMWTSPTMMSGAGFSLAPIGIEDDVGGGDVAVFIEDITAGGRSGRLVAEVDIAVGDRVEGQRVGDVPDAQPSARSDVDVAGGDGDRGGGNGAVDIGHAGGFEDDRQRAGDVGHRKVGAARRLQLAGDGDVAADVGDVERARRTPSSGWSRRSCRWCNRNSPSRG